MNKLKLFAFGIMTTLVASVNVNAMEVDTEAKLLDCIKTDGNTCILTKDVVSESRLVVDSGNEIVLDLNNKTLDLKFSDENYWALFAKGNLTIQGNGTINITNINGIAVTGELIIKNGTYNQPVGDTLIGNYGGNLVIENGTFIGDYYGINGIAGTTVIKNGNFKTNPYKPWGMDDDYDYYWGIVYDEENGAQLEVQKGTFNQILSWGNVLSEGAEVNYILEAQNYIYDYIEVTGNMTIELNGNKVTYDDASLYEGLGALFYVTEGGNLTINDKKGTGEITTDSYEEFVTAIALINGEVNVNGGTIKGNDSAISGEGIVNITGGTFEATGNVVDVLGDSSITGGTFTSDVKDYVASGYVSKKTGSVYIVGKEYKINLTKPSNGEVELSSAIAMEGDDVTISITTPEGYKVDVLKVVDKDGKELTVTDGMFTMPNSDVAITVSFVLVTEVEIPTVDIEGDTEEIKIGVSETIDVKDTILESLENNEELFEIVKDEEVYVEIEFSTVDEKDINQDTLDKIKEGNEKLTITDYFDVSIYLKKENEKINTVDELTNEIELMILLPESLKNANKDLLRKYYVIREHSGNVEKIEAKLSDNGKYLVFKSDKFSTYALAYEDVANVLPPKTGDNIVVSVIVGIMALLAFVAIGVVMKKRFN